MPRMRDVLVVLVVSFAALSLLVSSSVLVSGCNDVPVDGLQKSFSLKVTQIEANTQPVAVDFLWVIDNSASMCQEQAGLADSFDDFLERIRSFVNIDFRIAVVTTDTLTTDGHAGQFRYQRTTEFPFACAETSIRYCLRGQDEMCTNGYDEPQIGAEPALGENWVCDAPDKVSDITNCNDSLNSKCRKLCTKGNDWECDSQFMGAEQGQACEDDQANCRYKCLAPSTDNTGCVLRPATSGCPDTAEVKSLLIQGAGFDPNRGVCSDLKT
ncbi:MAG: hypothetical protein ACI9WU_004819, partial [Myxococcota bacterium]